MPGAGEGQAGGGRPPQIGQDSQLLCLCPPCPPRFIKSERSIILLNFCLSILASNILILVGQSRVLSKAGAGSQGCRGVRLGRRREGRGCLQVPVRVFVCMKLR